MTTEDVTLKIREKYKNISRFAVLSGMPYYKLKQRIADGEDLFGIIKLIEETPDGAIAEEVSPELIERVKSKLPENLDLWLYENGVQRFFLNQFLEGKIRFRNTSRVKRLLKLLKIK